jgi:hypothetical protein
MDWQNNSKGNILKLIIMKVKLSRLVKYLFSYESVILNKYIRGEENWKFIDLGIHLKKCGKQ